MSFRRKLLLVLRDSFLSVAAVAWLVLCLSRDAHLSDQMKEANSCVSRAIPAGIPAGLR